MPYRIEFAPNAAEQFESLRKYDAVVIRAIGVKKGSRLFVGGEQITGEEFLP